MLEKATSCPIRWHQHHFGREDPAETVPDQNDISRVRLVYSEPEYVSKRDRRSGTADRPTAESISGNGNIFARLISRIDLGVDDMSSCQRGRQKAMNMSREALKTCFVPKKPMDIDDEQSPPLITGGLDRPQRLG